MLLLVYGALLSIKDVDEAIITMMTEHLFPEDSKK